MKKINDHIREGNVTDEKLQDCRVAGMGSYDIDEETDLVVPLFVFFPADRLLKRRIFSQLVTDGCIELDKDKRQRTFSMGSKSGKASHWK